MLAEYATERQFAGRYVLRQMGLPPEAYPARLSLYCQIKSAPPPGQAFADPLIPARLYNLANFDFVALNEVRP
jgi:hypothetical protein